MQSLSHHQVQQVSGGLFGVTPGEMQQLILGVGFIVPRALVSLGLSATGVNMNTLTGKVISETVSVIMAAATIVAGKAFTVDSSYSLQVNNTTRTA